jgi:hypothetical protein
MRPEVVAVAREIVYQSSGGLCTYGKVCAICDCFADQDNGAHRDAAARFAARIGMEIFTKGV